MDLSFYTAQIPCPTRRRLSASCWRTWERPSCVSLLPRILYGTLRAVRRSLLVPRFPCHSFATMPWIICLELWLLQATTSFQVRPAVPYCPPISITYYSPIECCLYFNHTLFRGNRVSKMSSYDLNAFNSPNFPPLVNGIPHFRASSEPLRSSAEHCVQLVSISS